MAVQESVRRLGNEELVELFRRLHEHLSGNVYCNMAGCIRLRYECVEEDPDPYLPCVKEEPVVELYGYAEKTISELKEFVQELEMIRAEAESRTDFFRQGKASLDDVKRLWERYWRLVAWLETKLRASEKLLELALGAPPREEQEDTDPCDKIRDALAELLER
ncbi:MAG: hypothetical protein GSR81_02825 [Desulfurococcales archaeon]|nr:hypothetical protein [Desulfurococcales archaeon]